MTTPATLVRNANLADLVTALRSQQPRKIDIVAPVAALSAVGGELVIAGADAQLTADGVTAVDGLYRPTLIADEGIAAKLDIPPGYLARMRALDVDLYDQNVNGWLRHANYASKQYLVRGFTSEDGPRIARAFLSDSYKAIDNLDVLMTVLEGIGQAGVEVNISQADLTDRRMYVKVTAPQVSALAPTLLKDYRSPFTGNRGADNPLVFAGFVISNSEVGQGAFQIVPMIEVQVCKNGMTIKKEAIRAQHLGGKLEAGEITWGDDTQAKNLELIGLKTRDAVKTILDAGWLERHVAAIEAKATVEVTKPEETIKTVVSKLRYTEAQSDDILRMFIKGGDITAGGVMQAVTASAQNQHDADVAAAMESDALEVLALAAANA